MTCCDSSIKISQGEDTTLTYLPPQDYDFSAFTAQMRIWPDDGSPTAPSLTIGMSATVNGSAFFVVDTAIQLRLKWADVAALGISDYPTVFSYDIRFTDQAGNVTTIVGGSIFVQDPSESCGDGNSGNVFVAFDGCAIQIIIEGGNLSAGASVLLKDLNAAVESAATSATLSGTYAGIAETQANRAESEADRAEGYANDLDNIIIQPDGFGAPIPLRQALGNGYGNTPMLVWPGKRGQMNGTSILHQGQPGHRISDFINEQLGTGIVNSAWANSSLSYKGLAGYAALTDPVQQIAYVSAGSMMNDDVAAGLALYGPSSAYDDSFNSITKASQQTSEYRYEKAYDDGPIYFQFLPDPYNENVPLGVLNPPAMTVTAVSIGSTTTFTVNALDPELAVGSGFGARIAGIPLLGFVAGRVMAMDFGAKTVTINVNSTGYPGAMTSGEANHYNRATLYGAYQWMLHRLWWKARVTNQQAQTGQVRPYMILTGDPSNWSPAQPPEFMQGVYDRTRALQEIANKWNDPNQVRRVAFIDLATKMGISRGQHRLFMGDGTHPVEEAPRRTIANFYVHWMLGGENPYRSELDYPKRGAGDWIDNHQIEWSDLFGGAVTPEIFVGDPVPVITEDWVSAADWTPTGSPSVGAAPWGGVQAARFDYTSGDVSYERAVAGTPDAVRATFTLYMPDTTVVTGDVFNSTVIQFSNALGDWMQFNVVLNDQGASFNGYVYGANGNTQPLTLSPGGRLVDAVPSVIEITQIKKTATRKGLIQIKQDGVTILSSTETFDLSISPMTKISVGVENSNVPSPFTIYMGPLSFGSLPVYDYKPRFTGTLTATSSYQVVNGLITKVLP